MVPTPNPFPENVVRRVVDVVLSATALVIATPVLLLAGLLIKAEDGGPILHRRRVLGRGEIEFDAYKLRTMRVDADQWLEHQPSILDLYLARTKLQNDPRVTRIGRVLRRLGIDEIPQFANVLAGQMSIVGPRMIHPSELSRFGELGHVRMNVRPGVTGLWQVSRTTYAYDERVRLDQLYLVHRCLILDLRILLVTIPAIFGWRAHLGLPEPAPLASDNSGTKGN